MRSEKVSVDSPLIVGYSLNSRRVDLFGELLAVLSGSCRSGKIVGQKNWGQKNGRLGSLMFFIFLPAIFLPYQMHDRSSSAKLKMQFGANAS